MKNRTLDKTQLEKALNLLGTRLRQMASEPVSIVVCGGAALILSGTLPRATGDVDVVALIRNSQLADPDPLPQSLREAAAEVANMMGIDPSWLNNDPSRGDGGLYRMGLPEGFAARLQRLDYGSHLAVWFIDHLDQIYFKLYAAIDRGGYHIDDLRALTPTADELAAASRWCMTHDVSTGFRHLLKSFLKELGHVDIADRL